MTKRAEPPYIAVVGPSEAAEDICVTAEAVGTLLAEAGAVVVTGGLGGVMAAASRGAKSAGGSTLGLLPGRDRADANAWVDVVVPTGLGEGRNALVVRIADAVIAVGGSWGTLSETALAARTGTPVVTIRGWQVRDPTGAEPPRGPLEVRTAAEAVLAALAGARVP